METPTLYVKRGCPYCKAAMNYLEQAGIRYEQVEIRGDPDAIRKLEEISGQTKTPTLVWNGEVLANFGSDELADFLAARGQITVRPLA
jgi:glutaredoxin